MDYVSGLYDVTFIAGMEYVEFNITINDDKVLEINEVFTLGVYSPSLPTGVTVGSLNQVTVTILNDDGKYTYM